MPGNLFDRRRHAPAAGVARRSRRFPVDELIELITHRDPSVCSGALMVLGRQVRGDARVISTLVDTLRGDQPSEIRVQAVEKLGELADATVVPALKQIARDDPELRRVIAFAVASIETRERRDP